MKRDPDLEREILLAIEASDHDPLTWINLENIQGHSPSAISYHVKLLDEAGLIEAQDLSTMSGFNWKPKRITMRGHQYLENVRDPEIWQKTKDGAKKIGSFGLDTLAALAKGFIKKKIADQTGIELDF